MLILNDGVGRNKYGVLSEYLGLLEYQLVVPSVDWTQRGSEVSEHEK